MAKKLEKEKIAKNAKGFIGEFKEYISRVIKNTHECAEEFKRLGAISSGTDNHLFLLNVLDSYGITGKEAQNKLEEIGITLNKNMIPNDSKKPNETSGLRVGFAASTTRGCSIEQARKIAQIIHHYLKGESSKEEAKKEVRSITSRWKKITSIWYD